jgi:hypothetical protein
MFGGGFEQSTILRTGPDGLTRRHHAGVMGGARVGARRGLCGGASRAAAMVGVLPRGAGIHSKLGDVIVLTLRDECLLLRVPAEHLERHDLTRLENLRLRWRSHAVGRQENASTLSVEEHPEIGGEMHHAFDRNDILEIVLRKLYKRDPQAFG